MCISESQKNELKDSKGWMLILTQITSFHAAQPFFVYIKTLVSATFEVHINDL